jgi:hypothetical protein
MPRRSRKLPVASADSEHDFSISNADWRRIEMQYGEELPDGVRNAILETTQEFVYWNAFERSAEPVADAVKLIESFKQAAADFSRVILSGSSVAGAYARHLIEKHFLDPRLSDTAGSSYVGRFYSLSGILTSFQSACFKALMELEPVPSTRGVLGDLGALPSFKGSERLTEPHRNRLCDRLQQVNIINDLLRVGRVTPCYCQSHSR